MATHEMKLRPILFVDFDGTLCHDRFWRSMPNEHYEKIQGLLFGEDKTYLQDWMRGKKNAEEVNQLVAEKLGVPFQEVWEIFVKDAETMNVSQEALELIGSLRHRYTTILITVNMDNFSRFTVPSLKLHDYFDDISNSYHEGLFKSDNEGEVFKKYIAKYSAPIEESILIDDSPSACETFKILGGLTRQVDSEQDVLFHLRNLSNQA